jgi:hypothetical protein
MIQFQASFVFDAETVEEAKEIVGTWTVTPGVALMSLTGSIAVITTTPQPILFGGPVAQAFAKNDSAIPPPPPVVPSGFTGPPMPSRQILPEEL